MYSVISVLRRSIRVNYPRRPLFISQKRFLNRACFCLDEISFRRDYKSCRVDVVVIVVNVVVPQLWKLCDVRTNVILGLHFWDLVQCLLISFCFGSEILKKIGPPQPPKKPKKNQKKTYGFSRWDILPTL